MNFNNEKELKLKYAKLVLKVKDYFEAANLLEPNDAGKAIYMAHKWPEDAEFKEIMSSLLVDNDGLTALPTKSELAEAVWNEMELCSKRQKSDDFVKMARLYGEIMAFIEKPASNVTNNVKNVTNKVMKVTVRKSDADWRSDILNQQTKLVEDAKKTRVN